MQEIPLPTEHHIVTFDDLDHQIRIAKAISSVTKDSFLLGGTLPLTRALQRALEDEYTALTPLESVAWNMISCCHEAYQTLYAQPIAH